MLVLQVYTITPSSLIPILQSYFKAIFYPKEVFKEIMYLEMYVYSINICIRYVFICLYRFMDIFLCIFSTAAFLSS